MNLTLVPAYGRDYTSAKSVQTDWDAGKDFMINMPFSPEHGRYIGKNDTPKGTILNIRYKKNTQIKVIKV
jgi:hypothetical protein